MVIGKAVAAARARADRIGGGKTFRRILEQQRLARVVPPATATRLLAIIENLPAVVAWQATLTEHQQIAWASPSAVFKHCPIFAKAKSGARPVRTLPRIGLEVALDAVLDHLHEMDADNRLSVIERVLSLFNFVAVPKADAPAPVEPKPVRKRKADKLRKLVWKETKNPRDPKHPEAWARAAEGRYTIRAAYEMISGRPFIGYRIDQKLPKNGGERSIAHWVQTLSQAKAIAEVDHAADRDVGAKADPPPVMTIALPG